MSPSPLQESGPQSLTTHATRGFGNFVGTGQAWVWLTAGSIGVCILLTLGLLLLTMVRGVTHFWPSDLIQAEYRQPGEAVQSVLAEIRSTEEVTRARLADAGLPVSDDQDFYDRLLLKIANRDVLGVDFRYVVSEWLVERTRPEDAAVWERLEWGNLHGFLASVQVDGKTIEGEQAWAAYEQAQARASKLRHQVEKIERKEIGSINYKIEQLRLEEKRIQIDAAGAEAEPLARLAEERAKLRSVFDELNAERAELYEQLERDSMTVRLVDGSEKQVSLGEVVEGYRPNQMSLLGKCWHWLTQVWGFMVEDPREANTEGGIFPAIFGTVLMVLLMSVFVTPFGILAALYLREYASQGAVTRAIRIAVNNLAGVPSIVFGMFGLGFFVYFLGGNIDRLFYPEASPAPVFGTPGILWASLTLALLTLPVVIVATEEGLARIPHSVREASLALGATQAETLWRVVLPMASPAMMTGLILAIARAAGEVAPLMLVGVVKLAPSLPLDGNAPFLHLDRKFMHLGFHIYDVGFQSPNVEAARPLVYATSFLLVLVIILLNLSAISIRNRLRERYRALEH